MDTETRKFIRGEFAKVHTRLGTFEARLAKHAITLNRLETRFDTFEDRFGALEGTVGLIADHLGVSPNQGRPAPTGEKATHLKVL